MKKSIITGLELSAAFLGAVIGAGFASGQEVYRFFTLYGRDGIKGIVCCFILLFVCCFALGSLCSALKPYDLFSLLESTLGADIAVIYRMTVTAFMYVVFGVMASGMGALANQAFGLPKIIGFLVFLLIMAFVISKEESGIIRLCAVLTPVMIAGILLLCIYVLISRDIQTFAAINFSQMKKGWLISAVLYCGYNGLFGLAVLAALGKKIRSRTDTLFTAMFCAGGFGLCVTVVSLALYAYFDGIAGLELPVLYLASLAGKPMVILYSLVLFCAIITTGAGSAFVINKALGGIKSGALILCAAAIPFSFFDFSFLVENLYAFFGIAGFFLCLMIIGVWIKKSIT